MGWIMIHWFLSNWNIWSVNLCERMKKKKKKKGKGNPEGKLMELGEGPI